MNTYDFNKLTDYAICWPECYESFFNIQPETLSEKINSILSNNKISFDEQDRIVHNLVKYGTFSSLTALFRLKFYNAKEYKLLVDKICNMPTTGLKELYISTSSCLKTLSDYDRKYSIRELKRTYYNKWTKEKLQRLKTASDDEIKVYVRELVALAVKTMLNDTLTSSDYSKNVKMSFPEEYNELKKLSNIEDDEFLRKAACAIGTPDIINENFKYLIQQKEKGFKDLALYVKIPAIVNASFDALCEARIFSGLTSGIVSGMTTQEKTNLFVKAYKWKEQYKANHQNTVIGLDPEQIISDVKNELYYDLLKTAVVKNNHFIIGELSSEEAVALRPLIETGEQHTVISPHAKEATGLINRLRKLVINGEDTE